MSGAITRPYTGKEFLESLRDGREIWIYGQRVADVTTHPAFRNTARMIARLYDALHNPAYKDVLTTPTDTGTGGFKHKFYKASRNAEELVGARDAIAEWARVTYGWVGRSPDYKAAFLATLGANAPTSDTSGIAQPQGQVPAGSSTLVTASAAGFPTPPSRTGRMKATTRGSTGENPA